MNRHGSFSVPAKGANFVKTSNVIEMIVSVENMINSFQLLAKSLLAEVGASIDENANFGTFEVDG